MLLPCPCGTESLWFHDVLGREEKYLHTILAVLYLSKEKCYFEVVGTLMNAKSTTLLLKKLLLI